MKFLERNLLWFAGALFLVVVGVIVYMAVRARQVTATRRASAKPGAATAELAGSAARKNTLDKPVFAGMSDSRVPNYNPAPEYQDPGGEIDALY